MNTCPRCKHDRVPGSRCQMCGAQVAAEGMQGGGSFAVDSLTEKDRKFNHQDPADERTETKDTNMTTTRTARWFASSSHTGINPAQPFKNEYFEDCLTLMVIDLRGEGNHKDLRGFTTYGDAEAEPGDLITVLSAAPSQRPLGKIDWRGSARVVAVRRPDGTTSGALPTRSMPHWVAK